MYRTNFLKHLPTSTETWATLITLTKLFRAHAGHSNFALYPAGATPFLAPLLQRVPNGAPRVAWKLERQTGQMRHDIELEGNVMRPVCHLGYVVPNYDFAVRLFESVSIEAKLFLCCRLWPALSHHFFNINRLHKKHSLAHATVVHQHPFALNGRYIIYKQQRSHKSRRGSRPRHSCSTCTSLCRMLSDSALRFWWACCLRTSPSTNTSWKAWSPSKDGKSKESGWDMVRYGEI